MVASVMVASVMVASVDGAAVGVSGGLTGAAAAVWAVSDTGGEETLPAGEVDAGAAGVLTS
jgi:ribosomal protein S3